LDILLVYQSSSPHAMPSRKLTANEFLSDLLQEMDRPPPPPPDSLLPPAPAPAPMPMLEYDRAQQGRAEYDRAQQGSSSERRIDSHMALMRSQEVTVYEPRRQRPRSPSPLAIKRRRKRKRSSSSSSSSSGGNSGQVRAIVQRRKQELEQQKRQEAEEYGRTQMEFDGIRAGTRHEAYERHLMLNTARENQWQHERLNEKEQARLRLIQKETEKRDKRKQKEKEKDRDRDRREKERKKQDEDEEEEANRRKKVAERLAARKDSSKPGQAPSLSDMIKQAKEVSLEQDEDKKGNARLEDEDDDLVVVVDDEYS